MVREWKKWPHAIDDDTGLPADPAAPAATWQDCDIEMAGPVADAHRKVDVQALQVPVNFGQRRAQTDQERPDADLHANSTE